MASVTVKFHLPKEQGFVTTAIPGASTLAAAKGKVGELAAKKGVGLSDMDNYEIRTSNLTLGDERQTILEAMRQAGVGEGSVLELFLHDVDPLANVWREKVAVVPHADNPEIGEPSDVQMTVKVQFEGGVQSIAVAGDMVLTALKASAIDKLQKKGGAKNIKDADAYTLQVAESGLLLSNEGITVLDVAHLEHHPPSKPLTLMLVAADEAKGDRADANELSANYIAGTLNYQKGAKPTKKKKMKQFILEEFSLFYFHQPNDQLPKKTFVLRTDCRVEEDHRNSSSTMFYIAITFGEDTLHLGCASNAERAQWMHALRTARLCHFRYVLELSVNYLNETALSVPGLFRVSARDADVVALSKRFNEASVLELQEDPHVVANCLKRFFRSLPEPLLTYELYARFLETQMIKDEDERAHAITIVLSLLPPINKLLLQYLIAFLARVCSMSEVNEMNPANLATVFAPNLLSKKDETPQDALADTSQRLHLIKLLISEYDYFFGEQGADEDDEHHASDESGDDSSEEGHEEELGTPAAGPDDPNRLSMGVTPRLEPLEKPSEPPSQAHAPAAAPEATRPPNPNNLPIGVATFNFEPSDPRQLPLRKGAWVLVVKRNPTGWWQGESEGKKGVFPYNYVKLEEAPGQEQDAGPNVYTGAVRKSSVLGAGGPAMPAPSALRQRVEDEAMGRRQAEQSRNALSSLVEESRRAAAAEQRTRNELTQRVGLLQQTLQQTAAQAERAQAELREASAAKESLHKSLSALRVEHESSSKVLGQLLQERGAAEEAAKKLSEAGDVPAAVKSSVVAAFGMSPALGQSIGTVESLALEQGKRAQLEMECAAQKSAIEQMLPLAIAHLGAKGQGAMADQLVARNATRRVKQLEVAKAISAKLHELSQLMAEELADVKTALAS